MLVELGVVAKNSRKTWDILRAADESFPVSSPEGRFAGEEVLMDITGDSVGMGGTVVHSFNNSALLAWY